MTRRVVLCAVALLSVSACGAGGMERSEAMDLVEEHIDATVAALPEGVRKGESGELESGSHCDETSPLKGERVQVSNTYRLSGAEVGEFGAVGDAAIGFWESSGYTVQEDRRGDLFFVSAQNDDDGFGVAIRSLDGEKLAISSSSGCRVVP